MDWRSASSLFIAPAGGALDFEVGSEVGLGARRDDREQLATQLTPNWAYEVRRLVGQTRACQEEKLPSVVPRPSFSSTPSGRLDQAFK